MRFVHATLGALACLTLSASAAEAAEPYLDGDVSIGLGFGDPTALDVKLWTGNYSGLDLGLGLIDFDDIFGFYGEYELGLVAFHLGDSGARGAFYVGAGGAAAIHANHSSIAVVIPVGLDFRFQPPVDLFIEARPGIGLIHDPAFGIGGQLGVRFRI